MFGFLCLRNAVQQGDFLVPFPPLQRLTMTVRTRFAPSPTGYMHIGGMRTALFNWLFAKKHGGQFILRIDDTDQERNIESALNPILQAFRWLGLNWDEGPETNGPCAPYFQSQRLHLYRAAADRLLAEGKAYRCFDTPEQIQADRTAAEKEGRQYLNIRRSCELSPSQIEENLAAGKPWVLRFLVPREQKIELEDAIRGHVEWDAGLMSDPVIMRANGMPLYNFATVVDDGAMQISHVIRAEEHLPNTAIQILLHQALGNTLPIFAHIPYVAAPGSKEKLAKRKLDKYRNNPQFKILFDFADKVFPRIGLAQQGGLDPVMVEYYEKIGFIPAGVLNALARLGWSLDDSTELMSLPFLIENFSLERVVKAPAGFDPEKLLSYQAHWMYQLPIAERVAGCLPYLQKAGFVSAELSLAEQQYVAAVVAALNERIKLFSDVLTFDFFFKDEFAANEKDFAKIFSKAGTKELLLAFRPVLDAVTEWTAANLEAVTRAFCDSQGVGQGTLNQPLRICATGSPIGPGVFECLVLIGRDKTIARIDAALVKLASGS